MSAQIEQQGVRLHDSFKLESVGRLVAMASPALSVVLLTNNSVQPDVLTSLGYAIEPPA